MAAPHDPASTAAEDAEHLISQHRDALMERFPMPPAVPRTRRRKTVAALIVLVVAAAVIWADPAYRSDHLETAVGQQLSVDLADGSRLALNTNTSLEVSWHLRSRRVQLHSGQALFDVQHKIYRPFLVDAGHTRITVVGTMFDVWRKPDAVQVTVLRGRVKVQTDAQPLYLNPGQQTIATDTVLMPPVSVDVAQQMAWKEGKLVFERAPLSDVLQEMQRYLTVRIAPVEPALARMQVSGVFDVARTDSMLDLLPAILPVTVARQADVAHIVRRP